jgi:hypothetical protein
MHSGGNGTSMTTAEDAVMNKALTLMSLAAAGHPPALQRDRGGGAPHSPGPNSRFHHRRHHIGHASAHVRRDHPPGRRLSFARIES